MGASTVAGEAGAVPVRQVGNAFPGLPDAARLSETLLQAQSDLGDGLVVIEDERFVFVNDAFCRLTGYTRGELTGPEFDHGFLWAPHERDRMAERARARAAGEPPEPHYEVCLQPLRGSPKHCEVSVKPLDVPGRRLRFAIVRDVTERREAMAEVDAARRSMAQSEKLASLGSLVSGVAHELRTPLTYIQNNAYLMRATLRQLQQGSLAPEEGVPTLDASLRMLEEGVERANRLIKDLSRFTRMSTESTRERLDEVVEEALALYVATHPGSNVELKTHLEPTPPLLVDKGKIQQVVLNLVNNAHDALVDGGAIRVATHALPDGAVLVVQDNGPGIPAGDMGRLFEPFYTTKEHGMGLGLSIVRRIVELHRGTVRVESSAGHGTTFRVTLPAG